MKNNIWYLIQFNFAMLLMSTSGSLGRFISLPPPVTIWMRCILAAILLFLFIKWRKIPYKIHVRRHFIIILISSVFLGIHWITYFYSLQYSNVAIAMLSLFSYPVITTFLEPIMLKTKFLFSNLFLALLVLIGIFFLVPEFDLENDYTIGVIIGIVSAVLYSIRNLLLKKNIVQYSGITLMFYQLAINASLLWPVLFFFEFEALQSEWPAVLILAGITTATGHTLFVMSFKKFSISAISIMSSLQPLLGIFLAYIFLNEEPAPRTMIGGSLILATVIIESIRTVKK